MIYRGFGGLYVLECDVCGVDSGELFDTFMDAVEWKRDKGHGWVSRKVDEDWNDVCEECV